ncbi:hypothetical protein NL676_022805 [Syzygium grande]|nr:hypothetical protein NL676_022805 [Syzygium grande]
MVHRAHDRFHFLADCPAKIEAVGSYDSEILLGCSDGSLRVSGPKPSPLRLPSAAPPAVLPVSSAPARLPPGAPDGALRAAAECRRLHEAALPVDGGVGLEGAVVRVGCVRQAPRFGERGRPDEGERCPWGRGFEEVKEFGVPDTVEAMWCGENICLAIRREYVIMNATDGALSEVSPCGRVAPPLLVPLPSGELILRKPTRASSGRAVPRVLFPRIAFHVSSVPAWFGVSVGSKIIRLGSAHLLLDEMPELDSFCVFLVRRRVDVPV